MRKAPLVFVCVLLIASQVSPQRKRAQAKPKPSIPEDEILFDQEAYDLLKYRIGWRLAGVSGEDSERNQVLAYYDPQRIIAVRAGLKRAWVKHDNEKDGTLQNSFTSLVEFDCAGARSRTLAVTKFDSEGRSTGNADLAGPSAWTYIVPDTLNEHEYGIICFNRKDKERLDMEEAARWFQLGRQAEKAKHIDGAITWYEKAQKLEPDNRKIIEALILAKAIRK
jgi:hypothetical protein